MTATYRVTTYAHRLPTDRPLVMVDGTVPGWVAGRHDLHYDHHRPGGAEIQIDEIPHPVSLPLTPCFVTTLVDADACSAAAWVQLPAEVLTPEVVAKMRAIAWDCDHLRVPDSLSHLAEFAAKAVAAMKLRSERLIKELGLPSDRKTWTDDQWETYTSRAFQQGTEWLIAAAQGQRPWPGEQGEADQYWQTVAADAQRLLEQDRIRLYPTATGAIAACDGRNWNHNLDPRSFYQALAQLAANLSSPLRPETLTIREHRLGGSQYTLGVIPLHPDLSQLDYTVDTYERLTHLERQQNPLTGAWGGRRTVGGSGWNHPSQLTPEQVVAVLDGRSV